MAQRGRKPDTVATKVARGTMPPTPDVIAMISRDAGDVPERDNEFLIHDVCHDTWDQHIEHFVAGGATKRHTMQVNVTVFQYSMLKMQAVAFQNGVEGAKEPSTALASELRVALSGFGMSSPKDLVGSANSGKVKGNAFASNGNRPRA